MIRHSASHVVAEDFAYVQGIIDRNYIGAGPLCAELKALLAARFERNEVTLTHSGTAALHLALMALSAQYPSKTRVLVGAYLCPEVVSAVMQAGLEPIFVDCSPDSLNMDVSVAANRVDDKTLAIICTNIGGMPDDYRSAAKLGVPVISDCAQAVGSRVAGRDVASEGVFSILSFGATKMLTAGSGGALLSSNEELGSAAERLAQQELPVEEYRGSGFQVTFGQHIGDLTAGLAIAQLRRLDAMIDRRRQIAAIYDSALRPRENVALLNAGGLVQPNRFRYYFLSDQAPAWVDCLRARDIDARRSISHAVPEYLGDLKAFPHLARASRRVVSVPIFSAMTTEQSAYVAQILKTGPNRTS
jgi:perosamine synthetase